MAYDDQNVFAKILRGEIPNKTVHETDHALAFHDIEPQAETHVLVIPKGAYTDFADFAANAPEAEIVGYVRAIGEVIEKTGVAEGGFRLLSNMGEHAYQEVPHLHVHVVGGERLGRMLPKREDR